MLTKEQSKLISLIADFINERKSELSNDIDSELLSDIAIRQHVGAIVYYQTKVNCLSQHYAKVLYQYANLKSIAGNIEAKFSKKAIKYLIFKGLEIAKYYPQPELRQMGDIDVLVCEDDKPRASEVLESMGFTYDGGEGAKKPLDHEWCYSRNGCEVELHHRFLYDDITNDERHISYTDKIWELCDKTNSVKYELTEETHFVFLILHLLKHFLYEGIHIHFFVDIALMIKKGNLDWGYVEKTLEELELTEFAKRCFCLTEKWFEIESPIKYDSVDDDFIEVAEKTVFPDVYISMAEGIDDNYYLNTFSKNNTSVFGKIGMMLKVIFPGYQKMAEKYPKLKRIGALGYVILPFMWIHRMIDSLFGTTTIRGLKRGIKPLTMGAKQKERKVLLDKWGI